MVPCVNNAATELEVAVVGGHSEITESITQPIVIGFMIGVAPAGEYVTSNGVKAGDSLIVTKTVGIEGTSILAKEGRSYLETKLGKSLVKRGQELRNSMSIVQDGLTAFQTGFVHAMHDPTEGGLANGIHEMCDASGVGCEIDSSLIPLDDATKRICEQLQIDPLELISSGCMLISCDGEHTDSVIQALSQVKIDAVVIGQFNKNSNHRKIVINDESKDLQRPKTDALWDALKKVNPS
jgi:hydrogenase expression/formation protein HypE